MFEGFGEFRKKVEESLMTNLIGGEPVIDGHIKTKLSPELNKKVHELAATMGREVNIAEIPDSGGMKLVRVFTPPYYERYGEDILLPGSVTLPEGAFVVAKK